WRMLAEAAYTINTGVPWVASNVDRTLPTTRGRAPGNGALVEAVRLATGAVPMVAGKPETPMHREAVLRTGARKPLVVGDRLDTDIDGAYRSGADSLLVLTGVTDPEQLVAADVRYRPTYVSEDLRALLEPGANAAVAAGRTDYPSWTAGIVGGRVVVEPVEGAEPRRIDALRAIGGACWDAEDRPAGIGEALRRAGWLALGRYRGRPWARTAGLRRTPRPQRSRRQRRGHPRRRSPRQDGPGRHRRSHRRTGRHSRNRCRRATPGWMQLWSGLPSLMTSRSGNMWRWSRTFTGHCKTPWPRTRIDSMPVRRRLDAELVRRGLARSRQQ